MPVQGAEYRAQRVARGLPARSDRELLAHAQRRDSVRARVNEIKVKAGCADCGYDKHPAALDFDHLPGCEKIAGVNVLVRRLAKWELIAAEIAKCEVVCANCHRIRTVERVLAR